MAKNVSFERNKLVAEVEQMLGLTLKKSASATGGLSVSNESMVANGFAHLLCNEKNFQTVRWLLRVEIAIPPQFQMHYDRASFLYACGTAPRIVMKGSRHVSKDAVKTGLGQEFIMWAQAQRVAGVGGLSGLSASVRQDVLYGVDVEHGELVPRSDQENARLQAARDQLAVRKALEFGGELAARQVLKHQDIRAGVKTVIGLQLVAPKSISKQNKPIIAEEPTHHIPKEMLDDAASTVDKATKAEPFDPVAFQVAVSIEKGITEMAEQATAPKTKSKKKVVETSTKEVETAPKTKSRSRSKKQAVGE